MRLPLRRYIDYIGSWGPAIVGAADDEVNAALKAQIDKGTSFGAPCELEVCHGGTSAAWRPPWGTGHLTGRQQDSNHTRWFTVMTCFKGGQPCDEVVAQASAGQHI